MFLFNINNNNNELAPLAYTPHSLPIRPTENKLKLLNEDDNLRLH